MRWKELGLAIAAGLLAGCSGSTPSPGESAAPVATASVTPAPATVEPAPGGEGPVIHVNFAVPLSKRAPLGSSCAATDLRATGPKAAIVPGSPFELFDRERWAVLGATTNLDAATRADQASVGVQTIPDLGVVTEPLHDERGFPAACMFSFDVATSAEVSGDYLLSIGPRTNAVYFPIPILSRAELEAAGWVSTFGMSPQ